MGGWIVLDEEATSFSLTHRIPDDACTANCSAHLTSTRCVIDYEPAHPLDACIYYSRPHRSMFTVLVYLANCVGHDMWCNGEHMAPTFQTEGMIGIYDRQHAWTCRIREPLHCMQFHFPKSLLDQPMAGVDGQAVELLAGKPARLSLFDPILKYLALACIPLLRSSEAGRLAYLQQVMDAVVSHLARTYGRTKARTVFDRDRLAPWQIREVDSIVSSKIDDKLSVERLARACSLSISHFSYLFKNSTGYTPHQWLLGRRIDLAKTLLAQTNEPLASIACAAGFSDQSHFTRVFSRRVKASPSAWRREELARSSGAPVWSPLRPLASQTQAHPHDHGSVN
jgi:AraC-like DNA-binding protein